MRILWKLTTYTCRKQQNVLIIASIYQQNSDIWKKTLKKSHINFVIFYRNITDDVITAQFHMHFFVQKCSQWCVISILYLLCRFGINLSRLAYFQYDFDVFWFIKKMGVCQGDILAPNLFSYIFYVFTSHFPLFLIRNTV